MSDDKRVTRFDHVFQRQSGSREMVESEEGEWVRWEDVEPLIQALEELISASEDTLRSHPETACCAVTREKCTKAKVLLGRVPNPQTRCACHDFDGFADCPVHI
jgi:hypothetical protein